MTNREAEEILDAVRSGRLQVSVTDHFWRRVHERVPGFTTQDIYRVLRQGKLSGNPMPAPEYNNDKIKVRAKTADFGTVELVLGVTWLAGTCVTIYEIKR